MNRYEIWNEGSDAPHDVITADSPSQARASLYMIAWVRHWDRPRFAPAKEATC